MWLDDNGIINDFRYSTCLMFFAMTFTYDVNFNFLGTSTVRHFLPKMLGLWASTFPPTPDEAESEKKKGDPFTWQVTLECRAGALAGK